MIEVDFKKNEWGGCFRTAHELAKNNISSVVSYIYKVPNEKEAVYTHSMRYHHHPHGTTLAIIVAARTSWYAPVR